MRYLATGFIIAFLMGLSTGWAQKPTFHRVEAKAGDNAYVFLQRYSLEKHQCNFQQFKTLNKLPTLAEGSALVAGRKYYLPVWIYIYNGQSIRSTLGIGTWEQALRIKSYNEALQKAKLRKKTIVDSRILWVPYHELNCLNDKPIDTPSAPPPAPAPSESADTDNPSRAKPGSRIFPIFGPKYQKIPAVSKRLQDQVFYIVGGHGGLDPGALGKWQGHTLCEDEYAYDVALRLTRRLLEHGAIVYMITRDANDGLREGKYLPCDTDEFTWPGLPIDDRQKPRLLQRSNAINTLYEKHKKQGLKKQTVVAIHIDSRSRRQQADVFFYYFPGSKAGRKLANKLHRTLARKYKKHRPARGYHGTVTARDLHMLREPNATAVYIELGNIRNPNDQRRFLYENNRQAIANWLYEGLTY